MDSTPETRGSPSPSPTPVAEDRSRVLSELFDEVQQPLYQTLLSLVHNHETALEIANETFSKVWRKRAKFDLSKAREQQKAWILAFAPRVAIDYFRSAKAKKRGAARTQYLAASSDDDHVDDPPGRERSPEEEALVEELREQVRAGVDQLRGRDRDLALMELAGKSRQEIADALNLGVDTINVAMHRMYKRLAKLLAAYAPKRSERPARAS